MFWYQTESIALRAININAANEGPPHFGNSKTWNKKRMRKMVRFNHGRNDGENLKVCKLYSSGRRRKRKTSSSFRITKCASFGEKTFSMLFLALREATKKHR